MSNVRSHLKLPIRRVLERAAGVAPRKLLVANLALATLITLAHGGALIASQAQGSADAESIRRMATISLPFAGLVLLSSGSSLLFRKRESLVLACPSQGVILFVGALALLVWAIELLIGGIPYEHFSWGIGLLSAVVCYTAFLLSRAT